MSIKTTNFETSSVLPLNCRIGVIVACRLKSSRLKQKAILPIRGIASVERCLQNCLLIARENPVVLATSILPDDAKLKNYTLGGKVKFWKGHPEDVIQRYLGACEEFEIDVIVRVTADCPVVSPEIAAFLLQSHFESGADYTAPRKYAVGTNSEIYNTEALQRVIKLLGKAEHSEYMTWYMRNNPDVFKVNIVDLPDALVRDYRLTLDYPEDLEMFERLYAELEQLNLSPTTENVFAILDKDNGIAAINSHLTLRYQADSELIEKLNKVTRIIAK
jgi:N,N'-diacetyllegionaminate synthase